MAQPDLVAANAPTERSPLITRTSIDSESSTSLSASSTEISTVNGHDERTPAEQEANGSSSDKQERSRTEIARIILVLLIGIFVANADGSLLLATHPVIASEFNDMGNSSWLVISFALAGASTQTMYGKLSDIYGRKPVILVAYVIFTIGCGLVGLGQSMWQVVLGRVISGAGSSGMTVLVSVLITDLLPLRDVAAWRAYVNVVATTGRSLGGPLGGWLADAIGWRWSFFGQVPFMALAILLCAIYLPNIHSVQPKVVVDGAESASESRLRRIDFKGAVLFIIGMLAILFPLEIGGSKIPWSHPFIWSSFLAGGLILALFLLVERRAKEPIIPLDIFRKRDAVLSYVIMGFQVAAQLGLMFSVPIYFQVTANSSNAEAGLHLFPAVAGNAVGGVLSGIIIKLTGRYKLLVILATIASSCAYALLMLRWHGATNWWESLYIIPGGFGTGVAQSALFISLQTVVDKAHMASAVGVMYLSSSIGMIFGLACMSATLQSVLRSGLESRLLQLGLGLTTRSKIVSRAVENVSYVHEQNGAVGRAIVASYVDGLWWSHAVSLMYSTAALVLSLVLREHRLDAAPK